MKDSVDFLVDDPLEVPVDALDVRYVEELQVDLARPNQAEGSVEEHGVQNAAQDVLDLRRRAEQKTREGGVSGRARVREERR